MTARMLSKKDRSAGTLEDTAQPFNHSAEDERPVRIRDRESCRKF
jgi:hypothetical protein